MSPPIDVVGRMAAVLRVVASSEPQGVRTSEVADAAGLPRPTCHRLLESMSRQGFVDRADGARWRVGPELFLMGLGAAPRYDTRNLAHPILRQLTIETGESASFSVRRGEETVCVLHEEGTFPLRSHVLHEGKRFPLGVASAGIVILAFMPEDERGTYLAHTDLAANWRQAHAPEPLEARLAAARACGYSLNPGLIIEGSWGMAAAVFNAHETPIGAVSVTGIEARFGPERRELLGSALLQAGFALSTRLRART